MFDPVLLDRQGTLEDEVTEPMQRIRGQQGMKMQNYFYTCLHLFHRQKKHNKQIHQQADHQ